MNSPRISFKKPDYKLLKSKGYMFADMHFHTNYSDGITGVKDVLKALWVKGFGAAIADHNEIRGSLLAYRNRDGAFVIPAIEVSAKEGPHICAYFYSARDLESFYTEHIKNAKNRNPFLETKVPLMEILDHITDHNGISSAAHPSGNAGQGMCKCMEMHDIPEAALSSVDAIEAISGSVRRSANRAAARLAMKIHKPITGGSDGHRTSLLGTVVTYSDAKDLSTFLDTIRSKESAVVGKEPRMPTKLLSQGVAVGKHLHYFRGSMKMGFNSFIKKNIKYYKPVLKNKLAGLVRRRKKTGL